MRLFKIVSTAVAIMLLALIIFSANPVLLAGELAKSDIRFILIAIAISTAGAFIRVLKWGVLVNVGVMKLFPVQLLGLTVSNFTPGKVAEPAKAVLLKMRYGVDVSKSLPSIIWERINDLLVLVALSITAIQFLAPQGRMLLVGYASVALFITMIVVFIAVLKNERFGKRIFKLASRLPFLNRITESFIDTFYRSKIKSTAILKSLAITVLPWILEGYIFYFALQAVGINAEPFKLAGIIALAVLVGVMSSLPGGLGSFEAVSIIMLGMAGITGTKVVAGLILYRFLSFWYVSFLGWMSFIYLSRSLDMKSVLK